MARRLNWTNNRNQQRAQASIVANRSDTAALERLAGKVNKTTSWREDPRQILRDLAKHRWQTFDLDLRCKNCGHTGTATAIRRRQLPKLKCSSCGSKRFAARPR